MPNIVVRADAEHLPFPPESFDIVICNHVYEHTDNPETMLTEIKRVLSDAGICYFAESNKYDLIKPHYSLPVLSWLPGLLADRYIRLLGRGDRFSEKPYSYPVLKYLLVGFSITGYTGKILKDPVRYCAADILPPTSIKRLIAIVLLKVVPFFSPSFVFILRKPAPR